MTDLLDRTTKTSIAICDRDAIQGVLSCFETLGEPEPIERLLAHIGEPTTLPPIRQARAPPIAEADLDQSIPDAWQLPEQASEFEYDQTVSW